MSRLWHLISVGIISLSFFSSGHKLLMLQLTLKHLTLIVFKKKLHTSEFPFRNYVDFAYYFLSL